MYAYHNEIPSLRCFCQPFRHYGASSSNQSYFCWFFVYHFKEMTRCVVCSALERKRRNFLILDFLRSGTLYEVSAIMNSSHFSVIYGGRIFCIHYIYCSSILFLVQILFFLVSNSLSYIRDKLARSCKQLYMEEARS